MSVNTEVAMASLTALGLTYPEAWVDYPWGEAALKVRKKVFVFLWCGDGALTVSTKLPNSGQDALALSFASPLGYGLGRHGWVSARFEPKDDVPVDVLAAWIDESYRAVAPRVLVETLS